MLRSFILPSLFWPTDVFSLAFSKRLKTSESVANIVSSGDLYKNPDPVCVLREAIFPKVPGLLGAGARI